jgi:hypothetical protein
MLQNSPLSIEDRFPQIRISEAAKGHLRRIIQAKSICLKRNVSMTAWVSDLILAQPVPNGKEPIKNDIEK